MRSSEFSGTPARDTRNQESLNLLKQKVTQQTKKTKGKAHTPKKHVALRVYRYVSLFCVLFTFFRGIFFCLFFVRIVIVFLFWYHFCTYETVYPSANIRCTLLRKNTTSNKTSENNTKIVKQKTTNTQAPFSCFFSLLLRCVFVLLFAFALLCFCFWCLFIVMCFCFLVFSYCLKKNI